MKAALALSGPESHSEPALSGPKAFILHLQRASSRAANVQLLTARLPIESEVVGAIDGARLSPQEVDQGAVINARVRVLRRQPFS
jgi:hypothetical protein